MTFIIFKEFSCFPDVYFSYWGSAGRAEPFKYKQRAATSSKNSGGTFFNCTASVDSSALVSLPPRDGSGASFWALRFEASALGAAKDALKKGTHAHHPHTYNTAGEGPGALTYTSMTNFGMRI